MALQEIAEKLVNISISDDDGGFDYSPIKSNYQTVVVNDKTSPKKSLATSLKGPSVKKSAVKSTTKSIPHFKAF